MGRTAGVKVFESRGLNGNEKQVDLIKGLCAQLWDAIDDIPIAPGNSESGRLVSLAKTDIEAACMWAVKAVSRT
jgi:hypothetical protein